MAYALNNRFSTICAAARTRPKVCGWCWRSSPEMSSTPSRRPSGADSGTDAHDRKPLRSRKCSPPCTTSGRVAKAPYRWRWCHGGARATTPSGPTPRGRRGQEMGSPSACSSTPRSSARITMLPDSSSARADTSLPAGRWRSARAGVRWPAPVRWRRDGKHRAGGLQARVRPDAAPPGLGEQSADQIAERHLTAFEHQVHGHDAGWLGRF